MKTHEQNDRDSCVMRTREGSVGPEKPHPVAVIRATARIKLGSINISRTAAVETLSEIVGYKAGILIGPEELRDLLQDYDPQLAERIASEQVGGFRFHSSEFQEIVAHLLFKVGNIESPSTVPYSIAMFHKAKKDPKDLECYFGVMESYDKFIRKALRSNLAPGSQIDPEEFMRDAKNRHGLKGLKMAMEVIKGVNRDLHMSPWGQVREHDWTDIAQLSDLFRSESLETQYGSFFDQRFIDYLHVNFEKISNIHWRKFEGLAGEFFDRSGFVVDMGPGRNDDGIDLRIFPKDENPEHPPLIIVQCKRQKEKVGKAILKSVYADVLHEGAESGLIVTSSWLAPGAQEMKSARNYPVETADRDTLREWVTKMKTERISFL